MTPYALTAEQLLAAAMFTLFMDINRHTAVVLSSNHAAKELEMATPDVDPDLRDAVRSMLNAATKLDNYALNQPEDTDVSLAINASEWLRRRADRLLPAQPAWPTGPGLAEVIDMATWRRKA